MRSEDILRACFILMFSLLTVMRLYFKVKAGVFHQILFSRQEGVLNIVLRILLGIPLAAATAAFVFNLAFLPWSRAALSLWLRFLGIPAGSAGLVLLYFVHRTLGRNFSTTLILRNDHELVTWGPYRAVRHPMYGAYVLIFVAAFLLSADWVIGGSGLAVVGLLMTLRLPLEESLLKKRFGLHYRRYAQAVPRFFPRVRPAQTRRLESAVKAGNPDGGSD